MTAASARFLPGLKRASSGPEVRLIAAIAALLLLTLTARAQSSLTDLTLPAPPVTPSAIELETLAQLPPYHPQTQVHGTLRLWGHGAPNLDFMGALVQAWQDEFSRFQPGAHFEYDMYGTASAMGGLYTGAGDIAILGQEVYPFEIEAFRRVKHYAPTQIEIANGSVDVRNFDFALGVFVDAANPLPHLTLDQIDRVFAYQDAPAANILTWGQLGVTGPQASHPIHLYGWFAADTFSDLVQRRALHGSHHWRCNLREFENIVRPDGKIYDSGQQILDDLAHDPDGLGLANIRYLKSQPGAREIPLASRAGGPFYKATKQTIIARQYPLLRVIPALIDRRPGTPLDPAVKEFLRYLLSREGQAVIVRDGKYLPLSAADVRKQLEKLN